jgi:hypothetical protein
MWNRVRLALAPLSTWARRRGSRMRAFLRRSATNSERSEDDGRHVEARARFWAELREGQREAEAECARPATGQAIGAAKERGV